MMNLASDGTRVRVAWLALVIALSAAVLVVLRVTRALDIFCDWTSPCLGLLVATLPAYLAMLGLTLPVALIAGAVHHFVTSREAKVSALISGILASATAVLMAVAAYDAMWANYASTAQLDAPRFTPVLPSIILATTSVLWPVLLGASVVLTNLELANLRLSRPLVGLGLLAGFALVASLTFGHEQVTARYVAFGLVMAWAGAVALQLRPVGRSSRSAAPSLSR